MCCFASPSDTDTPFFLDIQLFFCFHCDEIPTNHVIILSDKFDFHAKRSVYWLVINFLSCINYNFFPKSGRMTFTSPLSENQSLQVRGRFGVISHYTPTPLPASTRTNSILLSHSRLDDLCRTAGVLPCNSLIHSSLSFILSEHSLFQIFFLAPVFQDFHSFVEMSVHYYYHDELSRHH